MQEINPSSGGRPSKNQVEPQRPGEQVQGRGPVGNGGPEPTRVPTRWTEERSGVAVPLRRVAPVPTASPTVGEAEGPQEEPIAVETGRRPASETELPEVGVTLTLVVETCPAGFLEGPALEEAPNTPLAPPTGNGRVAQDGPRLVAVPTVVEEAPG